ncbi:hypothetical protein [Streptomyces broussonetiae]|uniref:Cbb3-type cytochrome oxidase assembly protein CcoS n=1 Tax=Streptomyces broussonetiae TaxID=2686304 RepID=A0ABV5E5K3_9ACTN
MTDDLMTLVLVALLAFSAGWTWGHATARVRHILISDLAAQDDAALTEHDRATAPQEPTA